MRLRQTDLSITSPESSPHFHSTPTKPWRRPPSISHSRLDQRFSSDPKVRRVLSSNSDNVCLCDRLPETICANKQNIAALQFETCRTCGLLQSVNKVIGHILSLTNRASDVTSISVFANLCEFDSPLGNQAITTEWSFESSFQSPLRMR